MKHIFKLFACLILITSVLFTYGAIITVVPNNAGTSGNPRAPQGSRLYANTVYHVSAAEMAAFGANAITNIGWTWSNATAQNITTSGLIKVYVQSTTDATYAKGTSFSTAGMTKIIDGTITIPAVTAGTAFSLTVNAGGTGTSVFTPTAGQGLYIAFEYQTTSALATPLGASTVFCNNAAPNSLATYTSQTVNGTAMALSAFRPETRLGNALQDNGELTNLYTDGRIAIPYKATNPIGAVVKNVGTTTETFSIVYTVKNAATGTVRYTNTQTVTLAPAAIQTVTANWVASNIELDSVIVSISPITGETILSNNRKADICDVTNNAQQHTNPLLPITAGGVGYNTGSGLLVAQFNVEATKCAVVKSVTVGLTRSNALFGNTIYGVVTDALGNILSQSPSVVLGAGDTAGVLKTFVFNTPKSFYGVNYCVGIAQTANAVTGYFPLAAQTETPALGYYFGGGLAGGSLVNYTTLGKFVIQSNFELPTTPTITGSNVWCTNNVAGTVLTASSTYTQCGAPTYEWFTGSCGGTSVGTASTITVTPSVATTYYLRITDFNGIVSSCASKMVTPTAPPTVTATATPSSICDGDVVVFSGGGASSYAWSTGVIDLDPFAPTMTDIYTVTGTAANGCSNSATVSLPVINCIIINSIAVNNGCGTSTNKSATVTHSGGIAPFTFSISPNIGSQLTPGVFTNLTPNIYMITITDVVGTTSQSSITVVNPPVLSASATSSNVVCNGGSNGSANSIVMGGTMGYTYSWSNGATTANLTAIGAGAYTFTVTDVFGCTASTNIVVTAPPAIVTNGTATNCDSYTTPWNATVNTSGTYSNTYVGGAINGCDSTSILNVTINYSALSTSSYTACNSYTWPLNGTTYTNSGTFIKLGNTPAGCIKADTLHLSLNYAFSDTTNITAVLSTVLPNGNTVTNSGFYIDSFLTSNGCDSLKYYNVTITIPPLLISTTTQAITCVGANNGKITIMGTGGKPGYTYSLMPNLGLKSGNVYSNLPSNTYTATVIDIDNTTASTIVNIAAPTAITINVSSVIPTCNGQSNGTIVATGTGGTGTYTFALTPANGTQVTSGNFINLNSSIYIVKATDANGCTKSLGMLLIQPTAINFTSISKTNPSCFGASNGIIGPVVTAGGTGAKALALMPMALLSAAPAATYTLTATDTKGCTKSTTVALVQPTAVAVNATVSNPINGSSNGKIVATGTGGTGSKTFTLNPSATQSPANTFNMLAPGTYTLTATDAKGCTSTVSTTLTNITVNAIIVNEEIINAETENTNGIINIKNTTIALPTFIINATPNPTKGLVNISISSNVSKPAVINILNNNGQLILQKEVQLAIGNQVYPIDLSNLQAGTYYVQVSTQGNKPVIKLILKN